MEFRKTEKTKEQKQFDMVNLAIKYEQFLAKKISEKRKVFLEKDPDMKTLFEGWIYGVYVSILENQQVKEKKGKLYYLFENIPESTNKYKLTYTIDEKNNCIFNVSELKNFPKAYLILLKRHHFDIKKDQANIGELITAHNYKLDDQVYVHHSDYNKLNNNIKNLVLLEKEFFENLSNDQKINLAKAYEHIPEKYQLNLKKKPKEIIKLEYRACDLHFYHKIPPERIATTLRNRLKKPEIERTIKLYPYFKVYSRVEEVQEEK